MRCTIDTLLERYTAYLWQMEWDGKTKRHILRSPHIQRRPTRNPYGKFFVTLYPLFRRLNRNLPLNHTIHVQLQTDNRTVFCNSKNRRYDDRPACFSAIRDLAYQFLLA